MDLPFAVDNEPTHQSGLMHQSSSTLVTASSHGGNSNASSNYPHSGTSDLFGFDHPIYPPRSVLNATEPDVGVQEETIDFTYVNVNEAEVEDDEVQIVIDGGIQAGADSEQSESRGDVLSILLSGSTKPMEDNVLLRKCTEANEASHLAVEAKKDEKFSAALNYHTRAARAFRDAAVSIREQDGSLSNSLLVLSQIQARSALSLKKTLKQLPDSSGNGTAQVSPMLTPGERIRATVRGAMASKKEADISNSMFLGKAKSNPPNSLAMENTTIVPLREGDESSGNPVDEMMELERKLRDMDMELKLSNSVASLGGRGRSKPLEDGSFMVVPPGTGSAILWSGSSITAGAASPRQTPGGRGKTNRVQNMLESASMGGAIISPPPSGIPRTPSHGSGLESSWWGNQSTASHTLASSIVSISSARHQPEGGPPAASSKQVMRLMDALKTLGDENAILLREAEGAEEARAEAKATREQMNRFKEQYQRRFTVLKSALEKFRKGYPQRSAFDANPVTNSEFVKSTSTSDQVQRQEQLIRKLTADLKREKDESRKKDGALRKYESFYREVKARSAQKAAQRQKEARRAQSQS